MKIKYLRFIAFLSIPFLSIGQSQPEYNWNAQHHFDRGDTLRGSLRLERNCFDVKHYDLDVRLDHRDKSIHGSNTISFTLIDSSKTLQLDLFKNLTIDSVSSQGQHLAYTREFNAIFVEIPQDWQLESQYSLTVWYHGNPTIAQNAPWDGGITWAETQMDKTWFAVSCEGIGASLWWPNKDHLSDEPDSMNMQFTVTSDLKCISNGRLIQVDSTSSDWHTYHWQVSYPINNYNVTFYSADYVHIHDTYTTIENNSLDLDYFVLPENAEKAEQHFKQMHGILNAFEHYFGEYPYINDGFKLVEAPYLGMEHQSAIAYGNNYERGYRGGMIPADMDWDYILVHETGHEYFGNSVSCNDHAEMWIHESFTTYMESLYVEYHWGIEAALRYLSHFTRHMNTEPIIGPMGVNFGEWKSSDHYFKGSWILHSLRHNIYDDRLWFESLRSLYDEYQHGHVSTEEVIIHFEERIEFPVRQFFYQYLYTPNIPQIRIKKKNKKVVEVELTESIDDLELHLQSGPHGKKIKLTKNNPITVSPTLTIDAWKAWLKQRYLIKIE